MLKSLVKMLPLVGVAVCSARPWQQGATPASLPPLPYAAGLQTVLEQGLKQTKGEGVSVAVVVPGYAVWTGAAGMSDSSKSIPIQAGTLFPLGEAKHHFVSVAVLKLAEEGKLGLDDPLKKWIPATPNVNPDITLRMLVNHTSGLFDYTQHPDAPGQKPSDPNRAWRPEEILNSFVREPYFFYGEGWRYSNTNTLLLSMVVKKTTGNDVAVELRNRFFNPLGLNSLFVVPYEKIPDGSPVAKGWLDWNGDGALDDAAQNPNAAPPSWRGGDWYGTAGDCAAWLDLLFKQGKVLGAESIGAMQRFVPIADDPLYRGYGLGIAKGSAGDVEFVWHLGKAAGFTSGMIHFPYVGITLVLLTNDSTQSFMGIGYYVGEMVLGGNQ